MEEINSNIQLNKDFEGLNDDLIQAKKIAPFFKFLKLFSLSNDETLTLCIAAFRTLAAKTEGFFSREQMYKVLSYLEPKTASRIFELLHKYEWITNNGISYEIPDKVRYFGMFLISTLSDTEENYAKMIAVPTLMSELDDLVGSDEETSNSNIYLLIGSLKKVKSELESVLEQRSTEAAREALNKSQNIRLQIENIYRRMKSRNKNKYQFVITTLVHEVCAEIIYLHQELLNFIHDDIQANAKSFGEYLTPEQVSEALHKFSVKEMSEIIQNNFASLHESNFISKKEFETKALDFLERKIEYRGPTPPPPIVEIKKREVLIKQEETDASKFYSGIFGNIKENCEIPLKEVIIGENYGESIYRAGLLVTCRHDIDSIVSNNSFEILNDRILEEIKEGPVKKLSKGKIIVIKSNNN